MFQLLDGNDNSTDMNIIIMHKYYDEPIQQGSYVVWHHKWYGCVEQFKKGRNTEIVGKCFRAATKEDTTVEVDTDYT